MGTRLGETSLPLFQTAAILGLSWNVASVYLLASSPRTNHSAEATWLTSSSSLSIGFGALHTRWTHKRPEWTWLVVFFVSFPLCAGVNVLAARRVFGEEIPVESCLKFFQDYREAIRHTFIVHSVLFWASSFVMLFLLLLRPVVDGNTRHRDADVDTEHQNTKRNTNKGIRAWGRWWAWTILAIFSLQLVLFILIFHHFVPEQVLRKEAGGQLDEGKMTFGQILTIFMWASVLVDVASKDRAGTRMS